MADLYVSANFKKARNDEQTGYLIVMGYDLNLSHFNDCAKEIFLHLISKKHCKIKDIFNHVSCIYDVDEKQLQSDIIEFIRDLQWKNLILLSAELSEIKLP